MRFGFPDLLPLFSRPTAHKGLLLPQWTFQLGMGMPGASVNVGLHNTAGCYTSTIYLNACNISINYVWERVAYRIGIYLLYCLSYNAASSHWRTGHKRV